jgi:hypothetical protein
MSVVSPILHNAPAMWCAGALHGLVILVLEKSVDESQPPLCAASFPGEGVSMTARRFFRLFAFIPVVLPCLLPSAGLGAGRATRSQQGVTQELAKKSQVVLQEVSASDSASLLTTSSRSQFCVAQTKKSRQRFPAPLRRARANFTGMGPRRRDPIQNPKSKIPNPLIAPKPPVPHTVSPNITTRASPT